MVAGARNSEIAERLVISQHTVKNHVKNILGKLDARSRTEAAARARELGLL
jgi:DNA-binding NarL/FixJ family response regulator